ncbi:MAG: GIY-YIG nuclease family protein [Pseudohongiellaceae bacterium]|nr:GIY-YIG nuclease family protein [Pseudohongiellaceae bacterium]
MSDLKSASEEAALWHLYLVKCRNGSLYTGISTDVLRRFEEHQSGGAKGAKYLRGKGPLELVYTVAVGSKSEASVLEYRVKRLGREQKQQMITGKLNIQDLLSS